MLTEFTYFGVTPSPDLKANANRTLSRILDHAPCNSRAVALLDFDGKIYYCSVEIYSQIGPFTAKVQDARAEKALAIIERTLITKLSLWRKTRVENEEAEPDSNTFRFAG